MADSEKALELSAKAPIEFYLVVCSDWLSLLELPIGEEVQGITSDDTPMVRKTQEP